MVRVRRRRHLSTLIDVSVSTILIIYDLLVMIVSEIYEVIKYIVFVFHLLGRFFRFLGLGRSEEILVLFWRRCCEVVEKIELFFFGLCGLWLFRFF